MTFDSRFQLSLAKSGSMVAVESSGSKAMHSEMDRRGGIGAWITATGSFPLSITISAPARTRASSPAKSLAASASVMWITWSAMPRLYRHSVFRLQSLKPHKPTFPVQGNIASREKCCLQAIVATKLGRLCLWTLYVQHIGLPVTYSPQRVKLKRT